LAGGLRKKKVQVWGVNLVKKTERRRRLVGGKI